MKMKPKTKNETVLTVLKIFALLALLYYGILSVLYLVLYVSSLFSAQLFSNIYNGLGLPELKEQNFLKYTLTVLLLVALSVLKANVWYRAVLIIQNIKIENPFSIKITRRLEKMSYNLLYIWILGFVASTFSYWLTTQSEMAGSLKEQLSSKEFLFMAGLLFIVSQIFRHGVEIQSENDLTV